MSNKLSNRIYRNLTWPCFLDRNQGPTILLSGSGRSGTTWLEEVIASAINCRVVFEPFHMTRGLVRTDPAPWQFVEPDDQSAAIHSNLNRLFNGRYRNRWTDSWNTRRFAIYQGRVIKAIRSHGCLKYIRERFPNVQQIYVMRHPLGALSSYLPRHWPIKTEIFTSQAKLQQSLLADHLDYICSVKGEAAQIMLRWCLENYVALSQLEDSDALVVFYEHMIQQPEVELERLSDFLAIDFPPDTLEHVRRPAIHSAGRLGNTSPMQKISKWQKILDSETIHDAFAVVSHFGLDRIYSLDPLPLLTDPQETLRLFTRVQPTL